MKTSSTLRIAALCILALPAVCSAQMTDEQVVEYAQTALSQGKEKEQIGNELLSRGVTKNQAERLMERMRSGQLSTSVTNQAVSGRSVSRLSRSEVVNAGMEKPFNVNNEDNEKDSVNFNVPIYGHNIFNSRTLTFEPNQNAATPENYKLGSGDQLTVELWGDNEASIVQTITPEGDIFITQIGRIQLSGLTIKEAVSRISNLLKSKYSDIGGRTSVSVRLSQIRTVLVNVMGDVVTPGTYRLSSFSTVFNALYMAGGVTDNGSMRAIRVIRSGETIASVDVYGYLFDGKSDTDITLQDGDVIIVPSYVNLVTVKGRVKRPMGYEMIPGETLSTLIEYAGGFKGDAYTEDFCVIRETGAEREVATVMAADAASFELRDGDEVTISSSQNRFANKIEIRGCVFRPGIYELGGAIATVNQLINKAGGVTEDAFLPRALIMREMENLNLEVLSVDLEKVLRNGEDVLLKKNDILIVSSIRELNDNGTFAIQGYVAEPGEFPFAENTTVEDLIIQAGGLLDGASTARVDIARRLIDSESEEATDDMAETFTFAIRDGLVIDGGDQFLLKPYDVVFVRKSPSYFPQKYVQIKGQVQFPGTYVLEERDERLTDLIAKAGGLTQYAYVPGARLVREADDDEKFLKSRILTLTTRSFTKDSLNVTAVAQDSYMVAVNLQSALDNPKSIYDIVLKENDIISIPELVNIVKLDGEVMFPTAVAYEERSTAKGYIRQAGGFTTDAKRSKSYIIYADGHATKINSVKARVEPGSVIIVPARKKKKSSVSEVMATTSAITSIVSMLSILANMIK